jgi:hypothetical protein
MGYRLFDQLSLLHLAVGICAYFVSIKLPVWILINIAFEILENSPSGINFINTQLTFWPGGKHKPDTIINQIGDIASATLGWLLAQYIDKLGEKKGWYHSHR